MNEQYKNATDGMVNVVIGEEVTIDPDEAALVTDRVELVTDRVEPNELVHYNVNLNKRTCGCGHWQRYGIACKHALSVWEKYQEQLEEVNGVRMEADAYIEARARFAVGDQPYFLAEVFIEAANDLKTNRIKLPCESTYVFDVNKYPPKPLPKMKTGSLERRPRTGSRTHRRRPRRGVASAVNAVTINLHVSSMKFGLIGTIPMTWYSEISSLVLSIRTGTALARLDNFCDFTSKPAKNQGKWHKTRETSRRNFLKNSR